jgi:Ca2+-binding EF-hand superfamily protein
VQPASFGTANTATCRLTAKTARSRSSSGTTSTATGSSIEPSLPRFLTRNAGGSRSFSIRGTSDYRDLNRRGAPTWQVIDADGDGTISADEWAAAAARLASRDMNDDEILLPADLNPRLAAMDPATMNSRRRRRGPDAARLLGPHADWGSIRLALENHYGGGRYLGPDSFPLTPELFGLLDADGDGRIGRDEFLRLNDVPPHVVVAVDFGQVEDGGPRTEDGEPVAEDRQPATEEKGQTPPGPRLRLVHVAEELVGSGETLVEQPGRLTLELAGLMLTIYTNDTVAADDFEARARQALAMYDANKDGYLEASELPEGVQGQLGRFEALDVDDDGKVYLGEIATHRTTS